MASEAEFISYKLDFVTKKHENLVEALGQYVDQIVTKGRQWVALNQTEGFEEISLMLEQSVFFINQKCGEIKRNIDGPNQSAPSSSTAHAQTRTLETLSSIHPNLLSQFDLVKDLASRMKVVEEAVASLCTSREQIKQQGSNVQNAMEELSRRTELQEKQSMDQQEHLKEQLQSLRQDVAKQKHQTDNATHDIQTDLDKLKSKTDEAVQDIQLIQTDLDDSKSKTDATILQLKTEIDQTQSKTDTAVQNMWSEMDTTKSDLQKVLSSGETTQSKVDNLEAWLNQMTMNVDTLTNKIESACTNSGQIVGFSAGQEPANAVPPNRVFINYKIVTNFGNHFNPRKGVFQAPADGLYIVYLRARQKNEGCVELGLFHKGMFGGKELISWVRTSANDDVKSDTYIRRLRTDDTLSIEISRLEGKAYTESFLFSCYLLK